MTQTIDETLAERGSRYGEFTDHAAVTQAIKLAMASGNNWEFNLDDDQRECLEMIAHKVGRILNGDPDYIDSWTDIIGYTRLVEKRLIDEQKPATVKADGMSSKPEEPSSLGEFLNNIVKEAKAKYETQAEAEAEEDTEACTCPKCRPDLHAALDLLLKAGVIKHGD